LVKPPGHQRTENRFVKKVKNQFIIIRAANLPLRMIGFMP